MGRYANVARKAAPQVEQNAWPLARARTMLEDGSGPHLQSEQYSCGRGGCSSRAVRVRAARRTGRGAFIVRSFPEPYLLAYSASADTSSPRGSSGISSARLAAKI